MVHASDEIAGPTFEALLDMTLAQWPARMSFGIWRLSKGRTIIRGLTDFSEDMGEPFHGHPHEFLFQTMNWAVATAIHDCARSYPRHTLKLELKRLSRSAIREKFESDLRYWRDLPPHEQSAADDDVAVVDAYFARAAQ